ncbi:trypsin-like peptidase domain-containing protein [Nostoc sp.]|uniref:trypsin-like peptidase domain-containing protein n=1 Tax=Nostoc sp. TaxID=1180 RepID=UPI002FF2F7E2
MSLSLYELLQRCTVKFIPSRSKFWGTGFFVAKNTIITCAHVVQGYNTAEIPILWRGEAGAVAKVEEVLPSPIDLAILTVEFLNGEEPPCVLLDEEFKPFDRLYVYGYPIDFPDGGSVTINCEGDVTDKGLNLIKAQAGQIQPGHSGSPVLNNETGKVCGIISETRNRSTNLGGLLIPVTTIFSHFPEIRSINKKTIEKDKHWLQLLPQHIQPDKHHILIDYFRQEANRHRLMRLPLLNSEGKPILLPIELLCIDLPLKLTHNPLNGKIGDVENEGWIIRESFTSALLFDRAARNQTVQESEDTTCRLSNHLESGARLVLVGDPGCGKTTLLSSLAYHYAVRQLPDSLQNEFLIKQKESKFKNTLPDKAWIPVTLVCRDLLDAQLDNGLTDLIKHQLRRLGYGSNRIQCLLDFIEQRMLKGEILLLVDGLDEIPVAQQRQKFAHFLAAQTSMYPNTPVVCTSRIVGFRSIQAVLDSFTHLNVAPLGIDEKKQFVRDWAKLLSEYDSTRILDELESQICYDRKIAKLCENVLLLALIVQMLIQDGHLHRRRVDVYRRAIELMIERQRVGNGLPLVMNEVCPYLEHLAYCMRLEGAQHWTETRIVQAIIEVRKHEAEEIELNRRSPYEWINAAINQLGILNVAGSSQIDDRGYERRTIQFFHQSFQEYFAAQAISHGRAVYDNTGVLSHLRQKVHELDIVERKIESIGSGQETEPVAAGHWQEVVRFCISNLDKKSGKQNGSDAFSADAALRTLLPSHDTPAKKARALASFALQCLAEEPDIKNETAHLVIDTAIENLNDLDGLNSKQNTLMDEAFHAVMQSCFGQQCRDRLLQSYIQARDTRREKIGCVLGTATQNETLNADNSVRILEPLLEKLTAVHSVKENVDAALRLVEIFYRPQGQNASATIDFLPNELLHKTINILLATAIEGEAGKDAVSNTAVWALGWLTSAKDSNSYKIYTFTEDELNCLRQIIMTERRDDFARGWAALILSVCITERTVFAQEDWIYEWALVADGAKPHMQLPVAISIERPVDTYILKYSISSHLSIKAKGLIAIALGRLGHFIPEIVDPLLQIFQNNILSNSYRDEALVYLVLTGGSQVISSLIDGINCQNDDSDQYGLHGRCILALIGMGDINALKYQLDIGIEEQTDISAYAYALAGVANPQGRKVLESMKNHKKKEVCNAVNNALSQLSQRSSTNAKQPSSNSSEKDDAKNPISYIKGIFTSLSKQSSQKMNLESQKPKKGIHVDKEMSKRGHLIHKLKAKDTTGKWAYYFVHIRPEIEQEFLKALDSKKSIDLEDYGKVIGSCYGEKPNKKLRDLLKNKYGFDV